MPTVILLCGTQGGVVELNLTYIS